MYLTKQVAHNFVKAIFSLKIVDIAGMCEIINGIPAGKLDDLRFQQLQRVAVKMAVNVIDCGKLYPT